MRILSIGFIVLVLLCLFSISARGAADRSLVLYLMFDEGEGGTAIDASDYGNNGIIKGDPKWVQGQFGTALDLDGAGDTIEVPHHESLNITTAVTMEMWVKPGSGGDSNQAGIEKGGWEIGEYSLYPVYGGGTLAQFNDLPDGCDDEGVGRDIRGDGQWHHLAGVWDGKIITLYIDGQVARSTPCAGELSTNVRSLYIGSRNGGERFLIATVDEVRVYNRALTEEEIQLDMETSGLSVSPAEKMAICWGEMKRE